MAVTNAVRDFLMNEIRTALQEKRNIILTKLAPVTNQMIRKFLKQDQSIREIDEGIYQYFQLSDQIDKLNAQRHELKEKVEKSFNLIAKAYGIRKLELGQSFYYRPNGETDRYGNSFSVRVNFESNSQNARDAFNTLVSEMVKMEALEEAGLKEELTAVDQEEKELERRLFLALNQKALKAVLSDINARFNLNLDLS